MSIKDFFLSDNVGSIIGKLSQLAVALAALVGLFNVRSWIKQTKIGKRAELAASALDEMAFFYSKLEELVEWQFTLNWQEWGKNFREDFRKNFLVAKLKAHRLNEKEIDAIIVEMEKCVKLLPFFHKLCNQTCDEKDKHLYTGDADVEKSRKEFDDKWHRFQELWLRFDAKLSTIGLYKM